MEQLEGVIMTCLVVDVVGLVYVHESEEQS
jgi:hypothetical protein